MAIVVKYRWSRRLSMRVVKNGDVHVSAPIGTPRREVEAFINEHLEWIEAAQKRSAEHQECRAEFFNQLQIKTPIQRQEAIRRLSAQIDPLIEKHSAIMGVRPTRIHYRPMISRWGVCNFKTRSICFSLYLLLLPDWCVEHVVVHELCHLLEPTHNARFHSLMDKYYPQWREARKYVRSIVHKNSLP